MFRRTLFWKLLLSLVALTLLLSLTDQLDLSLPVTLLIFLLSAALASALLARYLARPLARMRRAAEAQAAGEQKVEWPAPTTLEMKALSTAVQAMALNLQDKIKTIETLLAEQRTIFESMAEGVLIVDAHERVLDVNRAAIRIFSIEAETVRGRGVLEVVRNARLAELVRRTLAGEGATIEGDVMLLSNGERHLQVHGNLLRDGARVKGAMLVLTDVTRLRQLETMQREFVSSASHELKTPVTSIKGFAETLAAEKDMDPEQAQRFIRIIARQTEQLGSLIDDLMELMRLEYEDERTPLERQNLFLRDLIDGALGLRVVEANQKNIALSTDADRTIRIHAHPVLMQRALINLVDNAIKYSPPNTTVRVHAESMGDTLLIRVSDQGPGIAPEHQDRIFERFYRVDKSRSRKLGGTGLGLSIVKHIVEAHGGTVALVSAPERGCTFTITLPA
ncbi:MAG: ATP-binding protein [Kiritimatiellae bacterium]|nr:ATP-binding protein [Kiritimatiellia bacterium]